MIDNSNIAILGAGLMGSCLALELSRRGLKIDIYDLSDKPVTGASLHNEGKLHLGFLFANDPENNTYKVMARGSLSFIPILEQLTGCDYRKFFPSRPFHYYVPKNSQLGLDKILEHFRIVEDYIHEMQEETGYSYIGNHYSSYHALNDDALNKRLFTHESIYGSISTEERSVKPEAVAAVVQKVLMAEKQIRFIPSTYVHAAERLGKENIRVDLWCRGKDFSESYKVVVNCLWDDRLRVDSTAGIYPENHWLFRYKATIRMKIKNASFPELPSSTGILGTYGDIVNYGDGSFYFSWYPVCKKSQTGSLEGRNLHERLHDGFLRRSLYKLAGILPEYRKNISSFGHRRLVQESLKGLAKHIPSVTELKKYACEFTVGGGVIYALGATDIDDPCSHLHRRYEIGPVAHDSYISVDTGKYCTAPMIALQTADLVETMVS